MGQTAISSVEKLESLPVPGQTRRAKYCKFCFRKSISNDLCSSCNHRISQSTPVISKAYASILKNIIDDSYILVFGYTRKHQNNLFIPKDIIQLIVWFLSKTEMFEDLSHSQNAIKLSTNNEYVYRILNVDKKYHYVFGKNEIKNGESMIWRIKIIETQYDTANIIIGIIESNRVEEARYCHSHFSDISNGGYGYLLCTRFLMVAHRKRIKEIKIAQKNCKPFQTNDIITMHADLSDKCDNYNIIGGKLNFFIERNKNIIYYGFSEWNFKPIITCFNNIDKTKCYRMIIGMFAKDKVQIL